MSLEPEILESRPLPDGSYYVQYAGWRDESRKAQGRGNGQFRRPDGGTITADIINDHRIQIPPVGRAIHTRIDRTTGREQGYHVAAALWVDLDTYSGPLSALQYREWTIDVQTEFVLPAIARFEARTRRIDLWGDRRGTTLNLIVGAGADDASESFTGGSFFADGPAITCNSWTTAAFRYQGGHRFTGGPPQGVTINSATMTLQAQSTSVDDPNLDMAADDSDSPPAFTDTDDLNGRTRTTATVSWVATGVGAGDVTTPDVTTVIQEIVDRAGYAGTLAMLLNGKSDLNRSYASRSYDSSTTLCARLDIDYTAASGARHRIWSYPAAYVPSWPASRPPTARR